MYAEKNLQIRSPGLLAIPTTISEGDTVGNAKLKLKGRGCPLIIQTMN